MFYPEPESATLEFKRDFPKNDQVIKTMIGFCNQNGGKLIIGINDQRKIIGVSEKEIEKALSSLDKAIYESTSPPIIPQIFVKRYEKRAVLIIEVGSGMNKPYYRRKEGMTKGTYIRLGRNTIRATPEIIQELQWQSRNIDFESLPIYQTSKDDLDEKKVLTFLQARKNSGKIQISDPVLDAYNLITKEQGQRYLTVTGVLLFGIKPQKYLSEAMIICTHFKGNSGRVALATIDCEGTLFEQIDQAYSFLIKRLHSTFSISGPKRKEQLEIPEIALREALINAVVHRNYHIKAPIKIAIFDDRIEVFSPGQFPGPLNVNNLQLGITYLRNPSICKILREAGYVEKLGTGFLTIFQSYRERGLMTPQVVEGENYIKCILPRVYSPMQSTVVDSGDDEILGLMDLFSELTIQDVMRHLAVSRSTAVRRLNHLLKEKLIQRVGKTRGSRYKKL